MKPSTSHFVPVRGLRYHVRTWGRPDAPVLVALHGWMDVSASFQFLVDALQGDWHVVAPDWRGFGLTDRAADGYWFADYLADLDVLLDHWSPGRPANVLGHSMGGNVLGLYAGIRPERIGRMMLAEGFGLKPTRPEQAPDRYAKWLDQVRHDEAGFRAYASLAEVAARLRKNNPRLSEEKARFLAPHWSMTRADGSLVPAADPRHRHTNPVLYRQEEVLACWSRATAPALWIWGGDPDWMKQFAGDDADDWARRRSAFRIRRECTIPESGHMLHHDQPEALAREIEAFLASA